MTDTDVASAGGPPPQAPASSKSAARDAHTIESLATSGLVSLAADRAAASPRPHEPQVKTESRASEHSSEHSDGGDQDDPPPVVTAAHRPRSPVVVHHSVPQKLPHVPRTTSPAVKDEQPPHVPRFASPRVMPESRFLHEHAEGVAPFIVKLFDLVSDPDSASLVCAAQNSTPHRTQT